MSKLPFLLLPTLLVSTSAFAMTCLNDYSGNGKGCANITEAAGDCTTLGYSLDDNPNCLRWLRCPFDPIYKRCVKEGSSTTCNETTEFAVCQTIDTCLRGNDPTVLGGTGSKCYYCKDGFEYKTGMTGYKKKAPEGELALNSIYGVKPSNWTVDGWETLNVAGCQCIKKWGCENYPLLTSSVDAVNADEIKSCPTLAKCGTCTDTCGNKYAKITSCVENAELVNGVCRCKEGYFPGKFGCVDCSASYKTLNSFVWKSNGIKNVRLQYYLMVSGIDNFRLPYIMLNMAITQPTGSNSNYSGNDEVIDDIDDRCNSISRNLVCNCYKTEKAFAEQVNFHNKNCPTMKVKMPTVLCNAVYEPRRSHYYTCNDTSCSMCEARGMVPEGMCMDLLEIKQEIKSNF